MTVVPQTLWRPGISWRRESVSRLTELIRASLSGQTKLIRSVWLIVDHIMTRLSDGMSYAKYMNVSLIINLPKHDPPHNSHSPRPAFSI